MWDWTLRYICWRAIWGDADATRSTDQFVLPRFEKDMGGGGIAYRLPDLDDLAKGYATFEKSYLQFRSPVDLAAMADKRDDGTPIFVSKTIAWAAFPRRIEDLFENSDENFYEYAETLGWPPKDLTYRGYTPTLLARQQDEYCEWFTHRDDDGVITRVDITAESPEYWTFLFQNEPQTCLALYREFVSPAVQLADLQNADGTYNLYNPWNSTRGAMHLSCPPNSLTAEVFIAAEAATFWGTKESPITEGGALIQCAKYGLQSRASDPTIGADVNALIRQGNIISIADPVGLYLQDLDTTGWTDKKGNPYEKEDLDQIVKYQRGPTENMRLRIKIEVPKTLQEKLGRLGECKIGGDPIKWTGQIIDTSCTVSLTGIAIDGKSKYLKPNPGLNAVVPCKSKWSIEPLVGPRPRINPAYPKPEPCLDLYDIPT